MRDIANNFTRLREVNAELVRSTLKSVAAATKTELASATGLSVATCANILSTMLASGEAMVKETGVPAGGRPPKLFAYDASFSLTALIFPKAIAGKKILLYAIVDAKGDTVEKKAIDVKQLGMAQLTGLLGDIRSRYKNLKVVAVAAPGLVRDGNIGISDIDELENMAIREPLEAMFSLPVVVENDTNCAAVGFHYLHRERGSTVVYMVVPSKNATGAGIVIDGKLHRGHTSFAGELSFMPLGVTRERQFAGLTEKQTIDYVSRLVTMVIPVVNPSVLVIGHETLDAKALSRLRETCAKSIPEEHMPALELRDSLDEDCLAGLAVLAANRLSGRVRLVEED